MTDLAALAAEMTARANAAATIDWEMIYKSAKIALAEASANGGVITYQVNGRSVTRSVAEIREIIALAKKEIIAEAGGVIIVDGEFG